MTAKEFTQRTAPRPERNATNLAGTSSPMKWIIVWWGFCMLLFVSGWPIQYSQTNFGKVLLLVLASAALAVIGFRSGRGRGARPTGRVQNVSRAMLLGLLLSLILFVPTVQAYAGLELGQVGSAVQDQSGAYQQTSEVIQEGSSSRWVLLALNTLVAPLTIGVIPYFVLRAVETSSVRDRLLAIISIAPSLLMSLLTGRTQAVGVVVVVAAASLLLAGERTGKGLSLKRWLQIGGLGLVLFILLAWRTQERGGGNSGCLPGQLNCADQTSGPTESFVTVTSYASQGFEGLGRAMEGTWSFGGGFSHSPALRNLVDTFTDLHLNTNTITSQLPQHGWHDHWYWSSGWSQLANDIPWLFIPFFVGAIATLCGAAWRRAVWSGDWLSVAVYSYLFLALAFMPQNYQLGASGPMYVGVLFLAVVFVIRELHERMRVKQEKTKRSHG